MRLATVSSSLNGGGAERVLSHLANEWCRRGHDVTMITLAPISQADYPLLPGIRRVGLNLVRPSSNRVSALFRNVFRVISLGKTLSEARPDVVVSFLTATNILSILAARPLLIPIIVSERSRLNDFEIGGVWRKLRRWAYRYASAIVALSETTAEQLRENFPGVSVSVIGNPVVVDVCARPDQIASLVLETSKSSNTVLACGRLATEKGFDLLLEAFAIASRDRQGWQLVIVGEGPDRALLQDRAARLGIAGCVQFPGFSRTPHALMTQSQIFVLSSRFEGMPNALLEAMACGMACVSFDCQTGPREMIEDGESGLLAPPEDVGALATALGTLMDNPDLRDGLARGAKSRSAAYAMPSVVQRWDELFDGVLERRHALAGRSIK